jgi:acetyltransferase-like isoleucine patch superfamily enzyme
MPSALCTGGVTIGNHTRIACHTVIVASNHNFDDVTKNIHEQGVNAKGVVIGNDVWIGAGVRILDGVHIGDHVVIGAGSVVTKDIPENAIAVGVPARVIRKRGEQKALNNVNGK